MGKTLLLLGGGRYAMPVIEAAHDLGARVITCDYLPGNFAHAYSDGYVNASIIDKNAVLAAAKSVAADGIMSFAADPGVVSAAYAAEKLELPFQGSFDAVSILQDKERFRSFLRDNGFNCPQIDIFRSSAEALNHADQIEFPVIAKPVDSAGSKGCTRLDSVDELEAAVDYALEFSRDGRCIVEQFLEKQKDSSDADGFLYEGKFTCISFTSQLFDLDAPNQFAPVAYTMPASMSPDSQDELKHELQRLADLLELKSGIFNIETRVATDGKPYIMEMSPRGGGNRLAEMLRFSTDGKTDLIRASVQAALDMPVDSGKGCPHNGFWYQQMLHADEPGEYGGIEYAPQFKENHVAEEQVWIDCGARVEPFQSASNAFGSVFLRFDTAKELARFMQDPQAYMRVLVR